MHQINKDPGLERKALPEPVRRTARSDEPLADYLGYSGDLLSIIGKLAAYYAHDFKDRVVLDAVNEIEILSSSLSNKIWLKILVLRELMRGERWKLPHVFETFLEKGLHLVSNCYEFFFLREIVKLLGIFLHVVEFIIAILIAQVGPAIGAESMTSAIE